LERGYPLDAQPATFTVTGVEAGLLTTRLLDSQPAAFAVTGVETGLEYVANAAARNTAIRAVEAHSPKLVEQTSQIIGALTASALTNYELNAEPGVFTVTGTAASLVVGYALDAQPGSYAITGTAASLVVGYALNAEPGEYTITGVAATLEYTPVAAPPNTVIRATKAHTARLQTQTSQIIGALDASALNNYELDAQPGSFTVTGLDAGLEYGLAWDKVVVPVYAITTPQIIYGSRLFSGVEVSGAYELNAEPGSFTVTGTDAGLLAARLLDAQPAAFTITGVAATLLAARVLSADPGSFVITGFAANVARELSLDAAPGGYVLTGTAAGLLATRVLSADVGVYAVTGVAATLSRPSVDLWQDHVPGSVLFTDHTAATVTFADHTPDSVLFTDHEPD
jgi:uncharacterized surface anchored protein